MSSFDPTTDEALVYGLPLKVHLPFWLAHHFFLYLLSILLNRFII
jgi:hypothetical protein